MDLQAPSPTVLDRTLVDALRRRLADVTGQPVALVETHISWVLLADRLAYKLKKPVRLSFVDFSTLALRKQFCDEELRLNQRLAPSLYLGVVPVCGTLQAPHIAGTGAVIDYAVCMRRFAAGALLSERLAAGELQPEHLEGLACRLADFHRNAPIAPDVLTLGKRAVQPVLAVLRQLQAVHGAGRIEPIWSWFTAQTAALCDVWPMRQHDGRVRECHGDLHLANVALVEGEATPFDCIEFDSALRCTDVMGDVGFLTMDLKANGRCDLAFRFLDAYLQCSGDYGGVQVLRFYEVYRALVRSLVGSLRARVEGIGAPVAGPDYLGCAERIAQGVANAPRLLITHGVSGSGKSTLAQQLMTRAGAIRLRSDVERKRLFGISALDRSTGRAQIYGADATARTFDRLARSARTALRAGYPVIVDATFLRRGERDMFRALAAELRVPCTILHCTAGQARLRERVAARSARGGDASEADVAVLDRQLACREPLASDELEITIEVATDEPVDVPALCDRWLAGTLASLHDRDPDCACFAQQGAQSE